MRLPSNKKTRSSDEGGPPTKRDGRSTSLLTTSVRIRQNTTCRQRRRTPRNRVTRKKSSRQARCTRSRQLYFFDRRVERACCLDFTGRARVSFLKYFSGAVTGRRRNRKGRTMIRTKRWAV